MRTSDGLSEIALEESDATVRVNVNVPAQLWFDFEAVARAHFRSRSDHLRYLMDEANRTHLAAKEAQPDTSGRLGAQ